MKVLQKLDSKGKVRFWSARVLHTGYEVTHGIEGGKLQTEYTECFPKNVGRSNETTAASQAELEVAALYLKQVQRKGYRYSLDDAPSKIDVTLARDYTKLGHQVPAGEDLYCSEKLDGCRALWIPKICKFQSRQGVIFDLPHLEAVMLANPCEALILDGELMLANQPLNRILGAIKKPNELTPLLTYHVFDVIHESLYFAGRYNAYQAVVKEINSPFVKAVKQLIRRKSELQETHDYYVNNFSAEGLMIRRNDFPYLGTRAPSLYKLKSMQDAEFLVTGVSVDKRGQGVLEFEGFSARMKGEDSIRLHQAANPEEYIGKMCTVQFQTYSEYQIPIFPVAKAIRDYE